VLLSKFIRNKKGRKYTKRKREDNTKKRREGSRTG
jgi:hypothetical protein